MYPNDESFPLLIALAVLAFAIGAGLTYVVLRQDAMDLRMRGLRERLEHDEMHIVELMGLDNVKQEGAS